jgi:hypothetical protein
VLSKDRRAYYDEHQQDARKYYSENPQGTFTKFCNFIYCCEKEMKSRQLRVSFGTFYAVSDGYEEPSQKRPRED